MRYLVGVLALSAFLAFRPVEASTFATFRTSVGTMELQLFDEDRPITVSNFLKYATSGRFKDQFIQRWEPNFVIQGGGFAVTNGGTTNRAIITVPVYREIPNEYDVGAKYSNTYGTIAMARRGGATNSATSQWFLNLTNNAFLDRVDGGFTVFGKVLSGTNVLNLFVPPPPSNGIYLVNAGGSLSTLPTLSSAPTLADLIYVQLDLRRDLHLQLGQTHPGEHKVTWEAVPGVTNVLEFASLTNLSTWTVVTNFVLSTTNYTHITSNAGDGRVYRVKLFY